MCKCSVKSKFLPKKEECLMTSIDDDSAGSDPDFLTSNSGSDLKRTDNIVSEDYVDIEEGECVDPISNSTLQSGTRVLRSTTILNNRRPSTPEHQSHAEVNHFLT